MRRTPFLLPFFFALLLTLPASAAEAVQAPVGSTPVALPGTAIACAPSAGEWTTEADPHLVRPPQDEATIGHVVTLKIAPNSSACAASTSSIDLVATGRSAVIDPASVALAVDEARLDLRGRGLRGVGVHWQLGDHGGDDRCALPDVPAGAATGVERCSFSVARGLTADVSVAALSWFPAGGRASGEGVATFDVAGRRISDGELAIHPARVVVASLLPPNVSIDLVGDASRIPYTHPEAVAAVDCGASSCAIEGSAIVVRAVRNIGQGLAIRLNGLKGEAGFVCLKYGYRVVSLPGALAAMDLAILLRRAAGEASGCATASRRDRVAPSHSSAKRVAPAIPAGTTRRPTTGRKRRIAQEIPKPITAAKCCRIHRTRSPTPMSRCERGYSRKFQARTAPATSNAARSAT